MLNGLDLFSGIGGLTIALEPWVFPVTYCETDRYCQAVLLSRMRCGDIAPSPIWDDVRTLSFGMVPQPIDIIYGGFPCQDISVAGLGAGLEGKRSGLFFEIMRLVTEINPAFIFLENVPAIRTRGGERVGKELASRGYDCRWGIVSAAEVGAPHLRKRWFLLAHSKRVELRHESRRRSGKGRKEKTGIANDGYPKRWNTMPEICGVVDGVPNRMDRIRALGNSVVPAQARTAFKRLMGLGEN